MHAAIRGYKLFLTQSLAGCRDDPVRGATEEAVLRLGGHGWIMGRASFILVRSSLILEMLSFHWR